MSDSFWIHRLTQLQQLLADCPTDLMSRSELARLLEELGQYEEACSHWTAVLAADANNLKAREGMSRCRTRTGRSLQSGI
ncbi:MAG: hypothetical protein RI101_09470 [Nitrospira sp.]|jgi:thioredoxin-like negative regulator of GroEL|nr:hypothetical protein [Nitrospira sp.]